MASNYPASFLDDLPEWLMCTFCAESFSRQKQFLFLSCSKVACIDCALKMRSRSAPNKIDCALCKKTVALQQIREEMPSHLRKMFQNTEKMIEEAFNIYEFQQHLSAMALANMEKKIDDMENEVSELTYQGQEIDRETQRREDGAARYRNELAKVMTEERLREIETLSVDQVQQMSFDQLIGSGRRGHSSRSSSSRRSRSSRSSSEPSSEPSVVLAQMMNDMAVNHRRQSREVSADHRRQSRDAQVDARRQSRESRGETRRHSRDGRGDIQRHPREEAPPRRYSSRGDWQPNNEVPQNIRNRTSSRESRHSRHEHRSRGSGSGSDRSSPPPRRSHDSRRRSRDCFPNLHYQN